MHSSVCQRMVAQGFKPKPHPARPGTKDAPPMVRGPGKDPLEPMFPGLAVCGCGKLTMSRAAAKEQDWPVVDGVEHRYSLTCRRVTRLEEDPVPERAGRAGDQPLPTPGSGDVIQALVDRQQARLLERRAVGIRRYGSPLQVFNGRDVYRDAGDEALDLAAYLEQAAQEQDAVVQALVVLARHALDLAPNTALRGDVRAAVELALKLDRVPRRQG
jgi:hypothetical protein